uniref:Uncharacterized protein n=1 Tax=Arundo donax TaxID=35708 RepID=A0A0A9G5H2_ARUDO
MINYDPFRSVYKIQANVCTFKYSMINKTRTYCSPASTSFSIRHPFIVSNCSICADSCTQVSTISKSLNCIHKIIMQSSDIWITRKSIYQL